MSKKDLKAHVFLCTNNRDPGDSKGSCAQRGSLELREKLKKLCQDPEKHLHGQVRINASGCLGRCEKGIVCVIYPKTQWLENLTVNDDSIIMEEIQKAVHS